MKYKRYASVSNNLRQYPCPGSVSDESAHVDTKNVRVNKNGG